MALRERNVSGALEIRNPGPCRESREDRPKKETLSEVGQAFRRYHCEGKRIKKTSSTEV